MHYLCLLKHESINLCLAEVTTRRPKPDVPRKDGFVPFHTVAIQPGNVEGAKAVIQAIDESLKPLKQAPGVYRCNGQVLADAYSSVINAHATRHGVPYWLRWCAATAAVALIVLQTLILTGLIPLWLVVLALNRKSAAHAFAETWILFQIFDFRPTIRRLYAIWNAR